MIRMRTLFSIALPSMIAGGLVFGSSFSDAAAGDNIIGFWPAASDATSGVIKRAPPPPPDPPPPPSGPLPPRPPRAPRAGGFPVAGVKDFVIVQLDQVREQLRKNKAIPKHVRDKVLARLDRVGATVDRRLGRIDAADFEELGEEMEKMGEEIDKALEGLDDDLERLGDDIAASVARDLSRSFAKRHFKLHGHGHWNDDDDDDDDDHHDADDDVDIDDDNAVMAPDVDLDVDDDDLKDALSDLKDLALKPAQRDAINQLRKDSDRTVAGARKQLDSLSDQLRTALDDPATSEQEVARLVDQVSAQEASIRKVRILAWVKARRVLDDTQRIKIQGAAGK